MHGVQKKACAHGRAVGRRAVFRGAGANRNGRVSRRRSRRHRRSRSRQPHPGERKGSRWLRPRQHPRSAQSQSLSDVALGRTCDGDDLDSKPVDAKGRGSYKERFIHGEIYKVRPDVNAIIHSHSPTIVPFSVTKYPLKPILHNAAFLGDGPPIFDTRDAAGPTNLLVETPALGKAMAQTLGKANIVLMRGHGDTVVGPNVRLATFWAIYAEVNARQLAQAIAIGRPITFIEGEEQKLTHDTMATAYERPWQMWKQEALRSR
jgi:ribulose-5-phosphate 4-epimerase/fuculose-1-phosphate aldolase